MRRDKSAAAFHEDLPLQSNGDFVATIPIAELGVDPDLAALLVAAGPLCFLDFEATGLEIKTDSLIEAGAVLLRPGSGQAAVFNTCIHTRKQLSPFIRRLTGIRQEEIDRAPAVDKVAKALDQFIGSAAVVAHNARFEQSWLAACVHDRFAHHPFLDTVELLALVYPDTPNMKLNTFCRAKLHRRERHRALDDALDTLRITAGILAEARQGEPGAANARQALQAYYPSSAWLERLMAAPGSTTRVTSTESPLPAEAGVEPLPFELRAIVERLADRELCARVIPGYDVRCGQTELLRHVYDCFAGKGGKTIRLCEAGTGIGKTLAYLSVAIPFARTRGEPVIISTSSKLLQQQLIEKDIPAAARITGYPELRVTTIKGRANYLCRARLNRFLDEARSLVEPVDSFPVALLAAFARNAGHGEVDRIPGVLYQMHPELEHYRREVTSGDASECSRMACETTAGDCVFRTARNRLEGADLAVANHDLLLRWPPDYPELNHLIIDEVHELAERADGAYARSAEAIEIRHRIEAMIRKGSEKPAVKESTMQRALDLVTAVGQAAQDLITSERAGHGYRDELAVPLAGPGAAWEQLIDLSLELSRCLNDLGREILHTVDSDAAPLTRTAEVLIDSAALLRAAFENPSKQIVVRFRGLGRRNPNSWRLVATPVSPAADFQLEVLDRVKTLFGTSATVAVGGDSRGSVGAFELEERSAGRFQMEAAVQSPFDYEKHLEILFLDEPTDRATLVDKVVEVITTIACRLGGRTLALFTSRERLAAVTERLDAVLARQGISIIAPSSGNTDPHDLVRTFVDSDHAVLLGARAFWQGIDIPGDACQAVVIEKLPFDVPSDPLVQRRSELCKEEGGNPFLDYMLVRMLLRLKQMVGRLIRTPSDRGIVVVVEPRCEKSYFPRLRDALPPGTTHARTRLGDLSSRIEEFLARRNAALRR